jgi:hypothetical protein
MVSISSEIVAPGLTFSRILLPMWSGCGSRRLVDALRGGRHLQGCQKRLKAAACSDCRYFMKAYATSPVARRRPDNTRSRCSGLRQ